jgi:hypothetical protein
MIMRFSQSENVECKEPISTPAWRPGGGLITRHLNTADDVFGGPHGRPRTDYMIAAAIQWAERIMRKIDNVHPTE